MCDASYDQEIITKNIRCTIVLSYQEGHGGRGHCYFFSMEQVLLSSFSMTKNTYYNIILIVQNTPPVLQAAATALQQ